MLLGSKIILSTVDTNVGFVAFLGMFYVMDVDYPQDIALFLSVMHRILFLDNRVNQSILEHYDTVWVLYFKFWKKIFPFSRYLNSKLSL